MLVRAVLVTAQAASADPVLTNDAAERVVLARVRGARWLALLLEAHGHGPSGRAPLIASRSARLYGVFASLTGAGGAAAPCRRSGSPRRRSPSHTRRTRPRRRGSLA